MITDLLLMRHAESEGNIANRELLRGDTTLKEKLLQCSPSSYRLTAKGRAQARAMGTFIKREFEEFDHYLCADLVRTIETAVLLSDGEAGKPSFRESEWQLSPLLRERSWGHVERTADIGLHQQWEHERKREDFLTWIPPNGEHFTTTLLRARSFLTLVDMLGGRVIAVTSNQMIMTIDALIRCYTAIDAMGSGFGVNFPHNCQLIHYSVKDRIEASVTGLPEYRFTHVRSTSEDSCFEFGAWSRIARRRYSVDELKRYIGLEDEACSSEALLDRRAIKAL